MKVIQGIAGLVVGVVWGVSVMWAGGLYLPNSPVLLLAFLATAAVAIRLWKTGGRIGAVCLMVGFLGGPAALIGMLVHAASTGNPL
ncbi:MAG: hypothetical protein JWL77_4308 [Chthonomonadaceae bacterium]|nr:hypothetical protein [Chthonomonadaceae bacterium]